MKTFSAWWGMLLGACKEGNNQPSTGAVKVMNGRDKRVMTAAGDGW
jgi:hypothetical protein